MSVWVPLSGANDSSWTKWLAGSHNSSFENFKTILAVCQVCRVVEYFMALLTMACCISLHESDARETGRWFAGSYRCRFLKITDRFACRKPSGTAPDSNLLLKMMISIGAIYKISIRFITKTCLYNLEPLKPYFYIVKLYRGIHYVSYFCFKHRVWVLVRTASPRWF